MTEQKRTCRKCFVELPITEFTVTDRKGHRRGSCRKCDAARVRAIYKDSSVYRSKQKANSVKWIKANPERASVIRRKVLLKRKYGLTPEDFDRLFVDQGRQCALCGATDHGRSPRKDRAAHTIDSWPIDHCHQTGQVRGLICHQCNTQLGGYETLLERVGEQALLQYLQRRPFRPPKE